MKIGALAGVGFMISLAAILGASIWLEQSNLSAFGTHESLTYSFCSASLARLIANVAIAALALVLVDAAVQRWLVSDRRPRTLPTFDDVRYFRPLLLIGLNLAGLGVLVPWLRDWWPPIAYLAVDLHAAITFMACALFALEVAAISTKTRPWRDVFAHLDGPAKLLLSDVGIAAMAVLVVVVSSPRIRFSPLVVGDEPKYLRYCENWWQGRGLAFDGVQDISALTRTEPSHLLRNLALLGPAVRTDLGQLKADIQWVINHRRLRARYNVATYAGNVMVKGKNGRFYVWHNPGISLVILPAYAVDRAWFDSGTGQFPDDLFTVNLAFLLMFAGVAVAMWRLTLANDAPPAIAAVAASSVALSLPLAAFAFQFYPEMMGALMVAVLCTRLIRPRPFNLSTALLVGAGLGLLGWMHVRYLPMAAVGFGWMLWTHRRQRGAVALATLTFAMLTAALCLYTYHITGSIMPSATYNAAGGPPAFSWSDVPAGALRQLLDRDYGMLPLAPVFLVALPGLGVMLRRQRRSFLIVLSFGLALLVPVGGHGIEIAGTSPGRFILAAMPLGALPVAETLRLIRRRPILVAASVMLLMVSVWNCVAHNLQNEKISGTMMDSGFSGWNPSMIFPLIHRMSWIPHGFDAGVQLIWIALGVIAVAWGAIATEGQPDDVSWISSVRLARIERLIAFNLVAIAALGMVAIAFGGPRREPQFLPPAVEAGEPKPDANGDRCWIRIGASPAAAPAATH